MVDVRQIPVRIKMRLIYAGPSEKQVSDGLRRSHMVISIFMGNFVAYLTGTFTGVSLADPSARAQKQH